MAKKKEAEINEGDCVGFNKRARFDDFWNEYLPRAKVSAYSDLKRPPIPRESGHPFRNKSAADSEMNRPSSGEEF
jgi:hypothetical protein